MLMQVSCGIDVSFSVKVLVSRVERLFESIYEGFIRALLEGLVNFP